MSFAEVIATSEVLASQFGMAVSESVKLSYNISDGAKALGVQTTTMANIVGSFRNAYNLSTDQAHILSEQTAILAAQNDVAPKQVLEDIAASTEEMARFSKGGVKNFVEATIQARRLGLSIKDVANTMDGLLNFEDSLNKELQASIMLGRRINLNEARRAAFAGDTAGALKAVVDELGNVDLENLDPLTLRSVADAAGVSTANLLKMSKGADKLDAHDVGAESMDKFSTSALTAKNALTEMQQITSTFAADIRALADEYGEEFFRTIKATFEYLRTQSLSANTTTEVISKPLVLEENDILKATMSSTDSVDIIISYLEIFDEKSA